MSSHIKHFLLKKVYPHHTAYKNYVFDNLKNVYVTYNHTDSKFLIQMSDKALHNENKLFTYSNVMDSDLIQTSVQREVLVDYVLSNPPTAQLYCDDTPKNIVIDFSSPNIAKPFHAGHLRSTIIGNFIANINKYFNNTVTKINYLGDWGTQFGILQYGLKEKNIKLEELQNDTIRKLYEVYVYANKLSSNDETVQRQARKYFSDIEQGRTDLTDWKMIRDVTVKELEIIYKRLGIQFDDYHWESDYNGSAISRLMQSLENQNIIATDNEGKKVVKVKDKEVPVLKSDNSTLYLSRDIAALLDRYDRYKFDKMLYVVDNAQTDHFTVLFEVMKEINKICAHGCNHIKFGRIRGMSTRTGNVVFLNDILDEAKRKMIEKQQLSKNTRSSATNDETCEILATTAVILNDLKQRRLKEYDFSWEKALQSEGDSGIKLQYLHCRLWSLEMNSGASLPSICKPEHLTEEIVGNVVAELAKFDNILYRAHTEYEACIIVNYLFRLARHVNKMFNELKLKNVETELAAQRLLVFHTARLVVKTGLEILGVKPLYEM